MLQQHVENIKNELRKVIVGQEDTMDLMIAGILAGGHILLEGVPGIAKTMTAKLLAKTIGTAFSRIQFTPDLMPSDVLGTTVFNMKTSDFNFNKGPIFANIVLIDEINRAPAKTQSALFEVMEENQITVDGKTYIMSDPFFVIATQNPIEQEGTYRLPEAQLDRFLLKINMEYPVLDDEKAILRRFEQDFKAEVRHSVETVLSKEDFFACRNAIEKVFVQPELLDYMATIVYQTRHHGDLFLGASPRASLALMKSAKAIAAMSGRDFVTPDDVRLVSYPVLNHRVILTAEHEMEGYTTKDVIEDIIKTVEVPR
jgi:MoxR-like ATPase